MDASDIAKKYRKSDTQPEQGAKSSPCRGYGSSEAQLLVKNIRLENEIKDAVLKTERYKELVEAAQDDANELSAEVNTLRKQKESLQQIISDCCKALSCSKLSDGVQQTTKKLSKTKDLLVSILSHSVDEREENDDNRLKSVDQLAKEVALTYREMRENCRNITDEGDEITHKVEQQQLDILRLNSELREEKYASAEAMKLRLSLAKRYDSLFSTNKRFVDNATQVLIRQSNERIMRYYYWRLQFLRDDGNPTEFIMSGWFDWVKGALRFLGLSSKSGRILFLGLDNAGKTTLLGRMKDGKVASHKPTNHPNQEEFAIGSIKIRAFDLGGHEQARQLWSQYFTKVDGIIFLVDAADPERIAESKEQLDLLLKDEALSKVPFVILGNKIDIPGSLGEKQFKTELGVADLCSEGVGKGAGHVRPLKVFMVSVVKEVGYGDAFRWLSAYLEDA